MLKLLLSRQETMTPSLNGTSLQVLSWTLFRHYAQALWAQLKLGSIY